MKRQLFASVNSFPFGKDAKEAADIVDDLPCILR